MSAIYHQCVELIEELDPALVVVNFAFWPAMDAVQHLNRHHDVISTPALADIFAVQQPYGSSLWKYPVGFPIPVPRRCIPENMNVCLRVIYNLFVNLSTEAAVWHLGKRDAADGVICGGAIALESAPATEQDLVLAAWAQWAPTVAVYLGSLLDKVIASLGVPRGFEELLMAYNESLA
ncbi:glycosyltransferase family 1 protein [Parathielavia appendiculata]|uniref:Glycosyltransferase family 1 protein n=1 Tax=Parathielavia appendiculata TaxID=2587402 RepID=A0AAN6TTU4_9PEZI|nr:glycosyltransferase family 1 protein [Parathielavia appendiculata]